jgi:hypothetical protein
MLFLNILRYFITESDLTRQIIIYSQWSLEDKSVKYKNPFNKLSRKLLPHHIFACT